MTVDQINPSALKAQFEAANQGHLFKHWDNLSPVHRQELVSQLSKIENPVELTKLVKGALKDMENAENLSEDVIKPLGPEQTASILDSSKEEIAKWKSYGMKLLASNKVGVILMAGGQGTRLGSADPKGCYDVGLPSHKSLFQLQAERILKLQQSAKSLFPDLSEEVVIPWYIMTSGPTRQPTEQFFIDNNYFGLKPENVIFFSQGVLPCFDTAGEKIIMESPSKIAVAPDGNGGLYRALHVNGILDDIKDRGIEHLHAYCVDNCLVRVADPTFIGFSAERNVDIGTKVVRKRSAAESVGLIVYNSEKKSPFVIEYSEMPESLSSKPDDFNPEILSFRAANIVNHYYSAKFLLDIPTWKSSHLPFHIANKKIPYYDFKSEILVKPSSPNGIKLEQFVFDVFPNVTLDKFVCLEVLRDEEFSPLKNSDSASNDNPTTSRESVLKLGKKWAQAAGAIIIGDDSKYPGIEISSLTSYDGEGLQHLKNVEIKYGDII